MKISRSAIKRNAKAQIRASVPHACLVALVYLAIVGILGTLSTRVSGLNWDAITSAVENEDLLALLTLFRPDFTRTVLSLAIEIVTVILGVGFTIYTLNVSRMRPASFGNLFDGFAIFLRALWLSILMGIFTFLWSLLFIIPGIIATYRYSQAMYLLIDNPDMSAMQCIRASSQMMKGHKWELFVLQLSFIGWALLSIIPLVSIWTAPYFQITYANYYNALLGLHNRAYYSEGPQSEGSDSPAE